MHRLLLLGATLSLIGCSAEKSRESPASSQPSGQPASRPSSQPPSQATISNEEIDSHIAWWRADLDLGRQRVREMNDLLERLNRKYSLADLHKIERDPELLAMTARHREEAMEHRRDRPAKAEGFDSVLAGLGRSLKRDGRMVHEVHHDERALSGARGRYGDAFVDAVLARSDDIAAAMTP